MNFRRRRVISTLSTARKYAEFGWAVFPVHGVTRGTNSGPATCRCPKGAACTNAGKHPKTRHGLNDASTEAAQIDAWFAHDPEANIGVRTGSASDLVVVDVDPRHEGGESLARLERELGGLPATLRAKTGGGGCHLYFRHPGGRVASKANAFGPSLPGVDVRADGGFVVAPPSGHASGQRYAWEDELSLTAIAPLPEGLLARMQGEPNAAPSPSATVDGEGLILKGSRNSDLARQAGKMRRIGLDQPEIEGALQAMNTRRCCPPLPPAEVARIAQSVARYSPEDQDFREGLEKFGLVGLTRIEVPGDPNLTRYRLQTRAGRSTAELTTRQLLSHAAVETALIAACGRGFPDGFRKIASDKKQGVWRVFIDGALPRAAIEALPPDASDMHAIETSVIEALDAPAVWDPEGDLKTWEAMFPLRVSSSNGRDEIWVRLDPLLRRVRDSVPTATRPMLVRVLRERFDASDDDQPSLPVRGERAEKIRWRIWRIPAIRLEVPRGE